MFEYKGYGISKHIENGDFFCIVHKGNDLHTILEITSPQPSFNLAKKEALAWIDGYSFKPSKKALSRNAEADLLVREGNKLIDEIRKERRKKK